MDNAVDSLVALMELGSCNEDESLIELDGMDQVGIFLESGAKDSGVFS